MSKTGWIALLAIGTCAGFVVGGMVGTGGKPEIRSEKESVSKHERDERIPASALLEDLNEARTALAEREEKVGALRKELTEMRAELATITDPDQLRQFREWRQEREHAEHQKNLSNRFNELRAMVLQRKDKGLRAQALAELAGSLESADPEERVLAMKMIPSLKHTAIDMGIFKPSILASVKHDDASVRVAALGWIREICDYREIMGMVGPMASDPYPDVRAWAAGWIGWLRAEHGDYEPRELMPVVRGLLQDEDKWVKAAAIDALWRKTGEAQESEIQDFAIELSRDPELAPVIAKTLGTGWINATIAQRLAEMYDEGHAPAPWEWRIVGDDPGMTPIFIELDFKVIRNSTDHSQRLRALEHLRVMSDQSMVPQLEDILSSDDAEGIRIELEMLIHHIKTRR